MAVLKRALHEECTFTVGQVKMAKDKGASIYDVRTEGGRGVPSKADIVSNLSKGGCVNLRRGGCQKSENFADIIIWKPPKVQKKILSGRQVTEACN